MRVIAFLGSGSSDVVMAPRLRAFRQSLKDMGYVEGESDFDTAFASLAQHRADALLLVSNDAFRFNRRDQIVSMAARNAVPTIYDRREYAAAGGLISYGPNYVDAYRQAGIYAGRVLKGEKPGDLPVVQSTKFELIINLTNGTAFGLQIPDKVLALRR
jgi:putative tryptophan/tyrosine transport system substrate-binding protein